MSGYLRPLLLATVTALVVLLPIAAGQNTTSPSASPSASLTPASQPASMSCCPSMSMGPSNTTQGPPLTVHQPTGSDAYTPTSYPDVTEKPPQPSNATAGQGDLHPPQTIDLGRIPPAAFIVGGSAVALVGGTGLFSRIQRHRALDQPVRARVMAAVEAEPGIHVEEIRRRLDMNRNAVRHHLDKLADVGLVSVSDATGFRCYFPAGSTDRRVMAAFPVLKSDTARRIARAAVQQPGITASSLGASMGLTPAGTHHHLKRMVAAGVVRVEIGASGSRVFPTEITARMVSTAG